MSQRTVDRLENGKWAVATTVAIAGLGLGVGSQLLVAAATLPLWYVGAAALGSEGDAMVRVHRRLHVADGTAGDRDTDGPVSGDPGDTITVRMTVQNTGSEPIVDVRVVDGVPEALPVVSGSPRACVSLEPLAETTVEYDLELRRGEHAFDDATVRTRDLTGTVAETWRASVDGGDAVTCSPAVESAPLGDGTNEHVGEVPTDEGGTGVEFHSVREYEPGDPVGAIDWRRYANTRELATVEYRAERATRTVCVVDARASQFRVATATRPPAIERSANAAERTFEALIDAGHSTGVVGLHDRRVTGVSPGDNAATRREASRLFAELRSADPDYWSFRQSQTSDPVSSVVDRLPDEAQVYLFTSFVDDAPVDLVKRLRAHGYAVRVVSPDVTADADALETRLQALDRRTRLGRARATGACVVDWDHGRPLEPVLRRTVGEVSSR
ncbi:DUF58 domain-containing protein [Natrinema sp. 74]|uniref:DUF58 domain-containing protein n=1 Tax=Natrinema sp. 74 TaxID=3384159 RepID=UPI0038D416AE